ncbi:hypothetical protein SAMN05421759_11087 [Roseivivax lentus]|uniref:DUF6455 domain-containing protein n=1 Tax=Roseivivax lentus TaxID=633194 RepID=A0A1N7NV98_9RHOB|nr:DUF6455 family protein [Roseivivax lentus]SIT02196.1 hypothetical protein SAMN05421759_11087 [Roseivivax lentus]
MPALSPDTLTIDAFEERMRLRRRMFAQCGVSVAALHAAQDLDAAARRSVETCVSCDADGSCAAWLGAGQRGETPPRFCPNRDLIASLRADGRADMPVS